MVFILLRVFSCNTSQVRNSEVPPLMRGLLHVVQRYGFQILDSRCPTQLVCVCFYTVTKLMRNVQATSCIQWLIFYGWAFYVETKIAVWGPLMLVRFGLFQTFFFEENKCFEQVCGPDCLWGKLWFPVGHHTVVWILVPVALAFVSSLEFCSCDNTCIKLIKRRIQFFLVRSFIRLKAFWPEQKERGEKKNSATRFALSPVCILCEIWEVSIYL